MNLLFFFSSQLTRQECVIKNWIFATGIAYVYYVHVVYMNKNKKLSEWITVKNRSYCSNNLWKKNLKYYNA